MRRTPRMLAALALLAAPLALAAPPTDEQIAGAVAAFSEKIKGLSPADREAYAQGRREAAAAALADLSIAEMSLAQVQRLRSAQITSAAPPEVRAAFAERLGVLAADPSFDGLMAAILRLDAATPAEAGPAAARHPALASLTLAQLTQVRDARVPVTASEELRLALDARAQALAADRGPDGAAAAALRLSFIAPPSGSGEEARAAYYAEQVRVLAEASGHPGLGEALRNGACADVLTRVGSLDEKQLANSPVLGQLDKVITPDLPLPAVQGLRGLVAAAAEPASGTDPALRESLRTKAIAAVTHAKGNLPDDDKKEASERSLNRSLAFLNGAFARGALVNQPAPDLTITWTNAAQPFTRLSDLKGKVVVLDFWATWCGPCIASFPHVRDLTKHYEGYPVVVLGVTSIQGYHYDRPPGGKAQRIDTKDDPAKEMGLMPEFVKQLDMTWTVAFSQEDVFNPEYGVLGIPHVAIIDPAGVVRHRGLHPGVEPEKKYEMINALLKEFNLPAPEAPAAGEGATKAGN